MRKAIIHIGHGKTGTSSIQKWFCENEKILKDNNFRYLESYRIYNAHHNLAPRDKSIIHENIVAKIKQEIENCSENIIVSSEQIYYTGPENFSAICGLFPGMEIEVVFYIRWHEDLIISSYMQWMRENKEPFESAFEFFQKFGSVFRFEKRINYLYSRLTARPNTQLRVYMDTGMFDALHDFLSCLGIAHNSEKKISVNKSISPVFSETLYQINKSILKDEDRVRILLALEADSQKLDWNLSDVFTNEQRSKMRAYFAVDDLWVHKEVKNSRQRTYWERRVLKAKTFGPPAKTADPPELGLR